MHSESMGPQAIDSVEEFVKECNGLDASPSERYEIMDAIVQARLDAVSSRPWQWQDYNTISHTSVNVEKRFVTQGAPPSSEVSCGIEAVRVSVARSSCASCSTSQ